MSYYNSDVDLELDWDININTAHLAPIRLTL